LKKKNSTPICSSPYGNRKRRKRKKYHLEKLILMRYSSQFYFKNKMLFVSVKELPSFSVMIVGIIINESHSKLSSYCVCMHDDVGSSTRRENENENEDVVATL
jgi:hypothetical protein